MNRLAFVLGAILVTLILSLSPNLMAQDPDDPGDPDTLYLTAGGNRSLNGDTLFICPYISPQDVIIYVNCWNDNFIFAFVIPFIDTCNGPPCNADLDSSKNDLSHFPKCYAGSRVEDFDNLVGKFTYYPPHFYLSGAAFSRPPLPPGDGLLATLTFTVFDTGRICLDTCFWPPSLILAFVDSQAVSYAPVFEKKTFIISNLPYSQADPNYDGKTDIADVVYLVNYIFRSGPPPCIIKSGDASCDGEVNVIDIVYLVRYIFKNGPAPGYCP